MSGPMTSSRTAPMTGRKYRMLNVLDEFTHECLAIRVARKLKAIDVIDVLSDLFILQGIPAYIRSDNGPEFLAKAVQEWIAVVGAKTAYIERGSSWEHGYIESFNARLRDELLDGEIFYTLREAQIVIESWRRHYNMIRPHASRAVVEAIDEPVEGHEDLTGLQSETNEDCAAQQDKNERNSKL